MTPEAQLRTAGEAVIARTEAVLPGWIEREAHARLEAWRALDGASAPAGIDGDLERAVTRASNRVVSELRTFFAIDFAAQRQTPLQILRTVHREVGAVLAGAGVPPVARDDFLVQAWPDDHYALAPEAMADLGDDELSAAALTWGAAKAWLHKTRREGSTQFTLP